MKDCLILSTVDVKTCRGHISKHVRAVNFISLEWVLKLWHSFKTTHNYVPSAILYMSSGTGMLKDTLFVNNTTSRVYFSKRRDHTAALFKVQANTLSKVYNNVPASFVYFFQTLAPSKNELFTPSFQIISSMRRNEVYRRGRGTPGIY